MKRNTGCGCNSHDKCPPMQACNTAKTHDHFCEVINTTNTGAEEEIVVIADVTLGINVEADIKLPTPANDIKHIRKNVFLTQCEAIPEAPGELGFSDEISLYIEGYVHKNIQYSEGCSGNIKDFSVNVPFKCYQRITSVEPIATSFSQKSNQISEIRILAKDGMGSDRCDFGSITFENFNEPIKCKILKAEVIQRDFPKNFDTWGRFNKITEKMHVRLAVRLTQKQLDD